MIAVTQSGRDRLIRALRAKAAKLKHDADAIVDQTGRVDADTEDTIELIRVLARIVEGKDALSAFGSPGDWGGEMEDALRDAYR